ncbi:hypothetical protein [Aeromonas diversa]|uniref:hypothetical protein n=1 Tax=Aeromonas diversa TaxID=502790 RepID=UPI0034621109
MSTKLHQRNYRDDMAQAIQQEHAGQFADAALSYKKAQHHAASADMLSKAKFAMARRIRCLKSDNDPQWRKVNEKYQQLHQTLEAR